MLIKILSLLGYCVIADHNTQSGLHRLYFVWRILNAKVTFTCRSTGSLCMWRKATLLDRQ